MMDPALATAAPRRTHAIEVAGIFIALAAVILKATLALTTFPGWDFDPFTFPTPSPGIGPGGAMACDAAAVLGCVITLLARAIAGARMSLLHAGPGAIGMAGVLVHSWPPAQHTVGDLWIGSSWATAALLGLVIAGTTRTVYGERIRAIVVAALMGFIALLAVRSAQQYLVEHAATLAEFRRNKAQVFAAQGWSPESPMAKAYERRIAQPEATAWFGLANVLATFAAAGTIASVGFLLAALRKPRATPLLVGAILILAASAATVFFAGGKGGFIATALGLTVLGAFAILRRRPTPALGGVIGLGALAATIALVIAGSMTEQLSLLFRWFYMQAAVRIGVENLPAGVGPDGFQAAYMIAKNALSPEDVTSAHNVIMDWFATLGIFGIAWIALLLLWIWRAGAHAVTPADAAPTEELQISARADRWCVAGIGALATAAAIRIDQLALTPDVAVTRLLGLGAFVLAAWITLGVLRHESAWPRRAIAAAAIAAAAHALIDVTGVWPNSVAMLMVLLGAAVPAPRVAPARRAFSVGASVALSSLGLLAVLPAVRVGHWETHLRARASRAAEVGELSQRWAQVREGLRVRHPSAPLEAQAVATDLARLTGKAPPTSAEQIDRALGEWELAITELCARELADLATRAPREWRVRREASRLWLRAAALHEAAGHMAEAAAARLESERVAAQRPADVPPAASELAWVSLAREALAQGPERQRWLLAAAAALEEASELAPYEIAYATRLMRLYEQADDPEKAAAWARCALELDAAMKYDREVKAMSTEDRALAKRLTAGS